MTVVVDASALAASLIDEGMDGKWARRALAGQQLIAPHVMLVECTNTLRLAELRNDVAPDSVASAFEDLVSLRVGLIPFHPFAQRIWQLRQTVTPYDAWYVAIAELYDVELATLDRRLARVPGPSCRFLTPPDTL